MQQEFSRTEILIGEEGIELLAKAIFYLLAWSHSQRKRRLLALLLPNQIFVSEFLRIYSIFYDKQLSNSSWTGDSQIALCGGGSGAMRGRFSDSGGSRCDFRIQY